MSGIFFSFRVRLKRIFRFVKFDFSEFSFDEFQFEEFSHEAIVVISYHSFM